MQRNNAVNRTQKTTWQFNIQMTLLQMKPSNGDRNSNRRRRLLWIEHELFISRHFVC